MHLVEVILQAPSSDLPWGRQAGCSSGTVRHLRTQFITVPCLYVVLSDALSVALSGALSVCCMMPCLSVVLSDALSV